MKTLFGIMMCIGLFSGLEAFSQKGKSKAKTKQEHDLVKLQDYSYPYYAIINNGPSPITGCFINYKNISYFVTTRHSFYTATNERKKISNVMIFIDPEKI